MSKLPFSLPVNVRGLPKLGSRHKLELNDEIKLHLISHFDLFDVEAFTADAILTPWKKDGVSVKGNVRSAIVQPCAITGDALTAIVDEKIDALFVPEGSKLAHPKLDELGEIVLDAEGDDLPETFTGDSLDLATIWMEFFTLGFNPYARADGVELDPKLSGSGQENDNVSPFAALASLKKH